MRQSKKSPKPTINVTMIQLYGEAIKSRLSNFGMVTPQLPLLPVPPGDAILRIPCATRAQINRPTAAISVMVIRLGRLTAISVLFKGLSSQPPAIGHIFAKRFCDNIRLGYG